LAAIMLLLIVRAMVSSFLRGPLAGGTGFLALG
jgi:hypothetical protein